ncbi:MAG: hypothetical protein JOY62_14865 [Acidobacteriaceae bacterium]|nr:hypothetical protein [Acidobacteriaceae bacterium]MBV9781243.1 hypothetical protein [Acidobacteriaceae bacterium]
MKNNLTLLFAITLPYATYLTGQNLQSSTPAQTPSGSVPRFVQYNGTVREPDGKAEAGTVDITFSLYERESDNTALWRETQQVNVGESGAYTVLLGSTTPKACRRISFSPLKHIGLESKLRVSPKELERCL